MIPLHSQIYNQKSFNHKADMKRVLVLILSALILTASPMSYSQNSDLSFNSFAWKDAGSGEENNRYLMVRSLQHDTLHVGLPQRDVLDLLGPPDVNSTTAPDGWSNFQGTFDAYIIRFYYNIT